MPLENSAAAPAVIAYDAFISYSHAKDKPVGAALQSVIQKLGKPWYQRRSLRVFRDDTSLAATPELWPTLEKTLDQSRFIIVLASPQFARSKWCGMEVDHWLRHKSLDTLLVAVTDGDLRWDAAAGDFVWDETTPLPALLRGHFRNEPKWIDLRAFREAPDARDAKFIDAAADLAAAVHGRPKEDLLSQELRQQKRALRLAWSAAASLTLLAGGAGWQWWEAEAAKRTAQAAEQVATEQRDLAERNLALARQAADDLVFKIAQGLRGLEGMRTESVRQILETAQGVMDDLAKSAPDDAQLQRSRFAMLVEFAVTYERAGDLTRAENAAEQSLAVARRLLAGDEGNLDRRRDVVVSAVRIGDIRQRRGRLQEALSAYEQGLAELRQLDKRRLNIAGSANDLALMLDKVGRVRRALGNSPAAGEAFEESIAIRRRFVEAAPRDPKWRRELASGLSDVGQVYLDARDTAKALAVFEESLALRRTLVAEQPGNLEGMRNLVVGLQRIGQMRRQLGDPDGMNAAFDESLDIMRRLIAADPDNTNWQRTFGVTLFQVGDAKAAVRDRRGAMRHYREALDVRRKLAESDPSNAQWQLDMVTALFRVSTLLGPISARRQLEEALAIAEAMARDGRLAGRQAAWPEIIRKQLAKLGPSAPRPRAPQVAAPAAPAAPIAGAATAEPQRATAEPER